MTPERNRPSSKFRRLFLIKKIETDRRNISVSFVPDRVIPMNTIVKSFRHLRNEQGFLMSPRVAGRPGPGSTLIPRYLLDEIWCHLFRTEKMPDSDTDLEERLISVFGEDQMEWSHLLSEKYRAPSSLGLALFRCYRPRLSTQDGLSSDEIDHALSLYQDIEGLGFHSYGPYPCDYTFAPASPMPANAKFLAFVINTSNGKGSHWVALFIDLASATCDYFDSMGSAPSPPVKKCVIGIVETVASNYFRSRKADLEKLYNVRFLKKKWQNNVTACGVYCILFVIERLSGAVELVTLSDSRFNDEYCENLRMVLWNTSTAENRKLASLKSD